jgi:5-methylcytosine-specific restriction endonuclease McrA
MSKLNQYEFSIEIDEYVFDRFVKNKVRDEYKDFKTYKKEYPNTKCNFILRDKSETTNQEEKIYLWDISERNSLGENINK